MGCLIMYVFDIVLGWLVEGLKIEFWFVEGILE